MAGVKLVGCFQSWPRIYTRDYPEQVQLVARVELELGKHGQGFFLCRNTVLFWFRKPTASVPLVVLLYIAYNHKIVQKIHQVIIREIICSVTVWAWCFFSHWLKKIGLKKTEFSQPEANFFRKGFWWQVTSPAARCWLYHRCLMKIVFFAGYWNRGIITTSGG